MCSILASTGVRLRDLADFGWNGANDGCDPCAFSLLVGYTGLCN